MTDKPTALRLADAVERYNAGVLSQAIYEDYSQAAAELRRLHAENERLTAEVANRNKRALDGDEAVAALDNVHAHYEGLEAQRDELLAAMRTIAICTVEGGTINQIAQTAIDQVEGASNE